MASFLAVQPSTRSVFLSFDFWPLFPSRHSVVLSFSCSVLLPPWSSFFPSLFCCCPVGIYFDRPSILSCSSAYFCILSSWLEPILASSFFTNTATTAAASYHYILKTHTLNMRSTFYLVLSTIATLVVAEDHPNAFNNPNGGYKFTVGEPTTLKWSPNSDSTVSLKLQSGDVLTPDGGSTIACE